MINYRSLTNLPQLSGEKLASELGEYSPQLDAAASRIRICLVEVSVMALTAFVTGTSGFVGGSLVARLLEKGWRVYALARSRQGTSAGERVKRLVRSANPILDDFTKLTVLEGDINRPSLGIELTALEQLNDSCDAFFHAAGDTRFDQRHREEISHANVEGTKYALAVARRLGVGRFYHVSTAYVFGDFEGVAFEEPHPQVGQNFRNPYEQSKWESEVQVTRWAEETGKDWMIYRPAIIAGDSVTGWTSVFTGYYGYMAGYLRLRELVEHDLVKQETSLRGSDIERVEERLVLPITVPGKATAGLSITPINYVVDMILALAEHPNSSGRVFHLVPEWPQTFGWWLDASLDILGIDGVRIVETSSLPSPPHAYTGRIERLIRRACQHYLPYISGEPVFDAGNVRELLGDISHPPTTKPLVRRLLDFAVKADFSHQLDRAMLV